MTPAQADTSAKTSRPIHILLCFDNNFWAPAYALMRGIAIATHRRSDLEFHLCHTGLSTEHRADLDRIVGEFGCRQHYYDLREIEEFNRVGTKGRYWKRLTHIIYARLMFDRFLPADIDRLVYLDCDMFVRHPIEEIAEMDLEGHPIAAVRDPHSFLVVGGRDMRQKQDLFHLADPYFNSGLLVVDMKKWRETQVLEKFEALIEDGTMERLYYDQDVLNLIFKNNWLRLPQMWNVIKPRDAHETFDPANLHYTGNRRPWNLVSMVAFARVYRHVMTNELFYRFFWYRMRRRLKRWVGLK